MRGNQSRRCRTSATPRPIPAHAGEPVAGWVAGWVAGAYPRACGGTVIVIDFVILLWGLSPRMRGNPTPLQEKALLLGPIPAHAGEPSIRLLLCPCFRAYPRACGGTPTYPQVARLLGGLSPRMRGNLLARKPQRNPVGPIPAHAGEPGKRIRGYGRMKAYPRACGGTVLVLARAGIIPGLSPRMRGNQISRITNAYLFGPIPAHAGEPQSELPASRGKWAYPRACGGTTVSDNVESRRVGLSPRMRGNPMRGFDFGRIYGPIPAHAGEPVTARPDWI